MSHSDTMATDNIYPSVHMRKSRLAFLVGSLDTIMPHRDEADLLTSQTMLESRGLGAFAESVGGAWSGQRIDVRLDVDMPRAVGRLIYPATGSALESCLSSVYVSSVGGEPTVTIWPSRGGVFPMLRIQLKTDPALRAKAPGVLFIGPGGFVSAYDTTLETWTPWIIQGQDSLSESDRNVFAVLGLVDAMAWVVGTDITQLICPGDSQDIRTQLREFGFTDTGDKAVMAKTYPANPGFLA